MQRDIEGWTSDTTGSSQDELHWEVATSGSSSSSSASSSDDSSSENVLGTLSDSDNSIAVSNNCFEDSEIEQKMEISDILTRRIAAKRKDLKHSTRLSYLRRKNKKGKMLKKKKSKKIIISSSSSSSDEAVLRNDINEPESSSRGFFTIDSILGPPVWQRFSNDSDQIVQTNDNRRNLQKLRARILRNLFDEDSDDDDSNIRNDLSDSRNNNCDNIDSSENHNSSLADHKSTDNKDCAELTDEQENDLESEEKLAVKNTESSLCPGINQNLDSVDKFTSSDMSENSKLNVNQEETGCHGSSASTVNNNAVDTCENYTPADSSLYTESLAGPSSASPNANITWAEFKRFKNKVQRASRQYRKHRSSGVDDSD